MTSIAVIRDQKVIGFDGPSADWRAGAGVNQQGRPVRASLEVRELRAALEATHRTDAHFTCYLLMRDGAPLERMPRLRKMPEALDALRSWGLEVSLSLLAADIDNPGHARWASDDEARARCAEVAVLLPTAGVYASRAGFRVVQPLTSSVAADAYESIAEAWREQLGKLGIEADPSCSDWTRLFRLPHVRRDRRPYRSPAVLLDAMAPIDPPAPLENFLKVPVGKKTRAPRFIGPIGLVDDSLLARAFEAAGWLGQSIGASKRAVQCPWETSHSMGTRFDTSTVLFGPSSGRPRGYFHCSHGHCVGRVQAEVVGALPAHARALLDKARKPTRAQRTLADTIAALTDVIRHAGAVLTVVRAQCGLGKTTAAIMVAIERARAGLKTAIAVPTHALARQVAAKLRALLVAVRRFFGPLSEQGPDGAPVCRYHDSGRHLANGGQSIPFQFCDGRGVDAEACEVRDTCTAYGGADGPKDALIAVGPHAMLREMSEFAGKQGLLVIDEPPTLLETKVFTAEQIHDALGHLSFFGSEYGDVMRPALEDVLVWVTEVATLDELGALSAATSVDASAAFPPDNKRGTAPPIRPHYAYLARRSISVADELGKASDVLLTIHHALTSSVRPAVRVELRNDRRVLVVTAPNEALIAAVQREGGCIVTDANADLHLPILTKVVGYDPPFHRFEAPDGAQVRRTLIRSRAAGRKSWLDHGRFSLDGSVIAAIELAVSWLLEERTEACGIIAPKLLRLVLDAALTRDVSKAWLDAKQSPKLLEASRAALAPILARLRVAPQLGHYGALRGLDTWKECDALVTLGDPWPTLTDAQHDVDFLALPEAWGARYEALTRAEIEQAHGRLRTVHRTAPARACHVGAVMPGGWDDLDVHVREVLGGRPRGAASMTLEEVRLAVVRIGGTRAAARAVGVTKDRVGRWLQGQGITPDDASALTRAASSGGQDVGQVSRKPPIERSIDRGFPRQSSTFVESSRAHQATGSYRDSSDYRELPRHPDDDGPAGGRPISPSRNARPRSKPTSAGSIARRPRRGPANLLEAA